MLRLSLAPLTFGAAACGGQARVLDEGVEAAPVDMSPGGPANSGAPDGVGAPDVVNAPDAGALPPLEPTPPGADDELTFGDPPHIDLIAGRVLELLETYCGACHSNGAAEGGFGDVLDIQQLIERGLIVPGSSATSPLLEQMSDGGVHPIADGVLSPRPLRGDLALLARFIDDLELAAALDCAPYAFISHDDLYALLSADIAAQPAPERPFVRYLDLTYASNAGLCGAALDRQRRALFKMINSVSTAREIAVPQAIDSAELTYRIDLRDYGWDREIDLIGDGSVVFSDAWLALVASVEPYASELDGPDANALREHTGTAVPVLPVNAFVYTSTIGDLYYALIGVSGSLDEMRLALGVDPYAAIADDGVRRAGFFQGNPESRDVAILRLEQGTATDRSYWILEDQTRDDAESLIENPLELGEGGHQTIYNLPNGMQAYWVESINGLRLGEIPFGCVDNCDRPAGIHAAACHSCHSQGLLPVADQIRDYVEANARQYDNETVASVRVQYPLQSELDALMLRDSEIHLSAVERAGVPRDTPDPISRVFLQFERDGLTAAAAAGELGVPLNTLYASLPSLDPRLQVLGTPEGSIDRYTFTDALPGALCALRAGARNRPLGCP